MGHSLMDILNNFFLTNWKITLCPLFLCHLSYLLGINGRRLICFERTQNGKSYIEGPHVWEKKMGMDLFPNENFF